MPDIYSAPTTGADMRSHINRLYFETVEAAGELENWRLVSAGKRPGTFKQKFTPFHNAFTKLYLSTRPLCQWKDEESLKMRMYEWLERCEGSVDAPTCTRDALISVGLNLFGEWSVKLFEQSVLEFR